MDKLINIEKTFERVNSSGQKIDRREFDGCTFKNCDFSNTVFIQCVFMDCEFVDCNMAMAKFPASGLKTVIFRESKLLGIRFDECEDFLFKVSFTDCVLDYSWFTRRKMQKTPFINCSLKEVNFAGADLSAAVFGNANLQGAVFDTTILIGADFSSAYNYSIDPELNSMKKAKFSLQAIHGLLEKYDIQID